jgi:hypothetical protein
MDVLLILLLLLRADSIESREFASARLLRLGSRAWPALERLLEAGDPEVRFRAFGVLAEQSLPEAVLERHPGLREACERREAARLVLGAEPAALGRLLEIREGTLLESVEVLQDPSAAKRPRAFALWVLENLGEPRAVLPLLRTSMSAADVAYGD